MARKKDAFKAKDTSFEAGYNQEPTVEETKKEEVLAVEEPVKTQIEEVKEIKQEPEPTIEPEKIEPETASTAPAEEFSQMYNKKSTVYLSILHKEMLRIHCFKHNISYTDFYHSLFEEFFADADDIRQMAIENIKNGLVKY